MKGYVVSTEKGTKRGEGRAVLSGTEHRVEDDWAVVPAGVEHNIVNDGEESMKLYTVYSPPEHRDGVEHKTKAEAEGDSEHFNGQTTE